MLGLHEPPQGSTLGELCSGWVHRSYPDYLLGPTGVHDSHDPVPASTHGVTAPCVLGALPSPSLQTSECIVSGVGWDLGMGRD